MPIPAIAAAIAAAAATGAAVNKPKKLKNIGERKKKWLDEFSAVAKEICAKNNVPYQMCVTQAALESGWGAAAPKFNHFGIKGEGSAGSIMLTGKEFVGGKYVPMKMKFAAYKTLADAIQGYCNAVKSNAKFKYANENFSGDLAKYIMWIWGNGYATDPNYVNTFFGVMSVIYRATGNEDFNLHLSKSDLQMLAKLKTKKAGSQRTALTESLLKDKTA